MKQRAVDLFDRLLERLLRLPALTLTLARAERRMRKLATLTAAVLLTLTGSALAANPPKSYVLPKHHRCRAHYVKRVEKVKRREHGRTIKVKRTVCVYVAPKVVPHVAPVVAGPSATVASPASPSFTLRARLDPSFTQNPSHPLAVTYDYSASAQRLTDGVSQAEPDLPSGVLELYSDGLLACSMDVGGSTGEGECPVGYSSYGEHTVIVVYLSGEASGTSGDESERIEPPNPPAIQQVWGSGLKASMTIVKDSASVTLSAPSFEGAASVGLTDNLGDTCVAAVSGSQASCSMTVSGEPSGLTVSYPGGTTSSHTEAFAPGGERTVTEEWGPQSVPVTPSVTAYRASVKWSGWVIGSSGSSKDHGTGAPPEPAHIEAGERLILDVSTTGDFPGDEAPLGNVAYSVEGPGSFTAVNTIYGLNPEDPGSADCSAVHNYSGQAEAQCELTFSTAGTYSVSVRYVSEDENYFGRAGPSATVDVG
jgi:hypothetical protein